MVQGISSQAIYTVLQSGVTNNYEKYVIFCIDNW